MPTEEFLEQLKHKTIQRLYDTLSLIRAGHELDISLNGNPNTPKSSTYWEALEAALADLLGIDMHYNVLAADLIALLAAAAAYLKKEPPNA